MSSLATLVTKERGALAGDAGLVTAAAFGLTTGLIMVIFVPDGRSVAAWVSLVSAVLSIAVVVLGPLAAWLLHGRRVTRVALLGAVVGGLVSGAVVMVLSLLAAAVGWVLSWLGSSEFVGAIMLLLLVGALFIAAVAWLLIDAVRDLTASPPVHHRLDVVRLVSAAVLLIYTIGVTTWSNGQPGDASGEAIIFAMAAGLSAALVVAGAEALTVLAALGPPTAGPPGP